MTFPTNRPSAAATSRLYCAVLVSGAALVSAAALFSDTALGEGAVRVLDCTVAQQCDARGECEATTRRVTFTMEPQDREEGGATRYALGYDQVRAEMRALSDIGPFLWASPQERNTLLASSDTHWLWHRLTLDPVPAATVSFLVCTFSQ